MNAWRNCPYCKHHPSLYGIKRYLSHLHHRYYPEWQALQKPLKRTLPMRTSEEGLE